MSLNAVTLEIEITIDPARSQYPGRRPKSPNPELPIPPRIPRIARLMALAVRFQDMVDHGEVRDYADLARLGYVSRARVTQIMNLLNLAPAIQESILFIDSSKARPALTEHALRRITSRTLWDEQLVLWTALQP